MYNVKTPFGERVLKEQDGKLVDIGSIEEVEKEKRKLRKEKIKEELKERADWEQKTINSQIQTIPDEQIPPAYINGEPYRIIDGKYVPLAEAEIILQEKRVKKEKIKLSNLTATSVV